MPARKRAARGGSGVRSMTGFGAGRAVTGAVTVSVEVKAVNGRYRQVRVNLPPRLASLEAEAVARVARFVRRGTVDVYVEVQDARRARFTLDEAALASYAAAWRRALRPLGMDPTPELLAAMPEVVRRTPGGKEAARAKPAVLAALDRALAAFDRMRAREGRALARDLGSHLRALRRDARGVRRRAPRAVREQVRRIAERVREIVSRAEARPRPAEIEREIAFLAERTDVAEELARLESHLDQFAGALSGSARGRGRDKQDKKAGGVGRRLDFLTQELGREVNTIGSKSQDAAIGRAVIEMKAIVERLREQVQNLE